MCYYLVLSSLKDSFHECQIAPWGWVLSPTHWAALATAVAALRLPYGLLILHSQHAYFLSNPHSSTEWKN